jgi:hypothetical protein
VYKSEPDREPTVTEPVKENPAPLKSVVVHHEPEHEAPVFAANGWRVRLFFPPGNSYTGQDLKEAFHRDHWLRDFGQEFGYQEVATDSYLYTPWEKKVPADEVSLVVVAANNQIVYQATGNEIPAYLADLRIALGTALTPHKPMMTQKQCLCTLQGHRSHK